VATARRERSAVCDERNDGHEAGDGNDEHGEAAVGHR